MSDSWWPENKDKPGDTIEKIEYIDSKLTLDLSQEFSFVDIIPIKCGHSLIHGRGVFANEFIPKNTLIERCPLVPLKKRSKDQDDPMIWIYCFPGPQNCSCEKCTNEGFQLFMVLGYGMIYNHQDDNNAMWEFNYKNLYADIKAIRDIQIGEEIFVNYGANYFDQMTKKVVRHDL
jgi:hypothetical protein